MRNLMRLIDEMHDRALNSPNAVMKREDVNLSRATRIVQFTKHKIPNDMPIEMFIRTNGKITR